MRYRVICDGLTYPVGDSLARVLAAGGISRLSDEDRARLTMKRAERGAVVNDIPPSSQDWLVAQGLIEPVDEAPPWSDDAEG
jgi:hypothetical protein